MAYVSGISYVPEVKSTLYPLINRNYTFADRPQLSNNSRSLIHTEAEGALTMSDKWGANVRGAAAELETSRSVFSRSRVSLTPGISNIVNQP